MAVFAIDNIDEGEEVCIWYGTDWAPTAADEEGASPGPKARDYATMADRERWAAQNDLGVARLRALGCMRETWMEQLEQIEALEAPGLLAEPSGVLPRSRNKRKGQLQAHSATDANTAKKGKPQAGDRRKDQEGAGSLNMVRPRPPKPSTRRSAGANTSCSGAQRCRDALEELLPKMSQSR